MASGWKSTVIGVVTVAGMATGAAWYFEPHSPSQVEQHQKEIRQEQHSDVQEAEIERRERELSNGVDAENREKLRPGEYRPRTKFKPKFRIP